MKNKVFVRAELPADRVQAFLQHIRDFDMANAGCHFDVGIDGPDLPMHEMIEMLRVEPTLSFEYFFKRQKERGT